MPYLELADTRLHYEETGSGQETIIFSSSYLLDHTHFAPQIDRLREDYRIIAYDHRGHLKSSPIEQPTTMQEIVRDGIAIVEEVAQEPVHWVGLSTGGFVGMRIALQRPALLRSLTLMSTSADAEPMLARIRYRCLFMVLRLLGSRPVMGQAIGRLFGEQFRARPENVACIAKQAQLIRSQDIPSVIRFGLAIFGRDDIYEQICEIYVPTLVVSGELDTAQPPLRGKRIAGRIPGARFELIPGAGHICTLEEPARVNDVLSSFLEKVAPG